MYQFCNPASDWSKRRVIDYEAQPVVSLGYDNLLFPFVIMIGGAAIAGKDFSQQIILGYQILAITSIFPHSTGTIILCEKLRHICRKYGSS